MIRRLLLAPFLAAALIALGLAPAHSREQLAMMQMIVGDGPQHGGATYTGPGDIVSGALWWYGLRAYSAAVAATGTQKAANIRRATDSHACDVLIATTGGLGNTANCGTGGDNGQTAASFCASTTCSFVTWYDQSGNAINIGQASGGTQPGLSFNCINTSLPCATGNGAQFMVSPGTHSQTQPASFSMVYERTTVSSFAVVSAFEGALGFVTTGTTNSLACFGVSGSATASDNAFHHATCVEVIGTGTSTIVVDGTASTSNGTSSPASGVIIDAFGQGNGSNVFTGKITEAGAWAGALNSTQYGNLHTNASAYYGTP